MAVLNKRAIVTAIEMYGVTAIRLGRTLNPSLDTLIRALFTSGEQGFFYDPNDLSTMYQDAAGTVPVTAVGQPVGLLLDKSNGLVLGNDLVVNGGFDSTNNWVLSTGHSIAAGKLSFNNATVAVSTVQQFVAGCFYEIEVSIESLTAGKFRASLFGGSLAYITTAGVHKFRCFATHSADTSVYLGSGGVPLTATIDYIKVRQIEGNHAYQTTSASRPILRQNAVTGAYYLEFDGSDDFLQTSNIDFTGTDKVSLFAGLNALSGVVQVIAELGENTTSTQGAYLFSLESGAYSFKSRGSVNIAGVQVARTSRVTVPDLSVVTASGDVSGGINTIKQNGVSGSPATADLGTGNYGNYPLYIGRRAGTSLPFTGHIYSLIGIGKLASDSETAAIEKELAKRTGVALNV